MTPHRKPGWTTTEQQMEFLGDKVLGLVMTDWLLELYPDESEADLSRRHDFMVSRPTIARIAYEVGLRQHSNRLLADEMEIMLGRMYRARGLREAAKFVRAHWAKIMTERKEPFVDAKTKAQQIVQAQGLPLVKYDVVSAEGPSHSPKFIVTAKVGEHMATGTGSTRRKAEQEAASKLIPLIS